MNLSERLQNARKDLDAVQAALDSSPGKFLPQFSSKLQYMLQGRRDIDAIRSMLIAREAATDVLQGLDKDVEVVDGEDTVRFGTKRLKFADARLLAVQAYLSVTWSIADTIIDVIGPLLFNTDFAARASKPKLAATFVQDTCKVVNTLLISTKELFGWPIALGYVIRNLFLHEAGRNGDWTFFESPTAPLGFKVSDRGWNAVVRASQAYTVEFIHTRAPEAWPWPQDDVRKLLLITTREMDEALGILLGTATQFLKTHVSMLVGDL
ncbi:MAG: hypothetical protein K8T20_13180 [Planctomycetes bacterium]|nr:hypothetical protein [Planctomycetota bacterium]